VAVFHLKKTKKKRYRQAIFCYDFKLHLNDHYEGVKPFKDRIKNFSKFSCTLYTAQSLNSYHPHSQLCLRSLCTKYNIMPSVLLFEHEKCHLFQYYEINKYILLSNIQNPTDISHCNISTFKTPYKTSWLLYHKHQNRCSCQLPIN
jgi:hypothetical protein